jgi:hypothetical protein
MKGKLSEAHHVHSHFDGRTSEGLNFGNALLQPRVLECACVSRDSEWMCLDDDRSLLTSSICVRLTVWFLLKNITTGTGVFLVRRSIVDRSGPVNTRSGAGPSNGAYANPVRRHHRGPSRHSRPKVNSGTMFFFCLAFSEQRGETNCPNSLPVTSIQTDRLQFLY